MLKLPERKGSEYLKKAKSMLFSYENKEYNKELMVVEQRRMFLFIHVFCFIS
jgi:hypothetical protein